MPEFLSTEQDNTLVFQITVETFGKPEKVIPETTKRLEDALRLSFHKNCGVTLMPAKKASVKKKAPAKKTAKKAAK